MSNQQTFLLTWPAVSHETPDYKCEADGLSVTIATPGPVEYWTGTPNATELPEARERELYTASAVHTPDPELTDALVIMRNLDAWRAEPPSFDKDDRAHGGYGLPLALIARDSGVDVASLDYLKTKTLYPGHPLSKVLDEQEEQARKLAAEQKEAAEKAAAERKRPRAFATGANGWATIIGPIGPIPPTCEPIAAALGDNAFSKSSKRERAFIQAPPGFVWPRTDLTNGYVLLPFEHVENLLPHEMPGPNNRNDWCMPFWDLIARSVEGSRATLRDEDALDLTSQSGQANYAAAVEYLKTWKKHVDYVSQGSHAKIQYHVENAVASFGNLKPELLLSAFEAADCLQDPAKCIGAGSSDSRPNRTDILARVKRFRLAGDRFVRSEVPVIVEQDDGPAIEAAVKSYLEKDPQPQSEAIHEHLAALGLKDTGGRKVAAVLRASGREAKIIPVGDKRERRWVQVQPCAAE